MDESTNNILLTLSSEIISAGIFSSILYTYVFILDAIIPGNWKDSICNLCRPLPGEIIFEEIREKANDKRFTKEKALQKYANIYERITDKLNIYPLLFPLDSRNEIFSVIAFKKNDPTELAIECLNFAFNIIEEFDNFPSNAKHLR